MTQTPASVREQAARIAQLSAALRASRRWVEANTAPVRGISPAAAAYGEAMLAQIDAALSAIPLPEQTNGEGWQPIESAPKDGTPVLLGRFKPGDEYDGRIRVDWWRNHMRDGYIGFGHFNPRYWPATHWMPLPPAPVSQKSATEKSRG